MLETTPILVALIAFASVTGIVFVVGRYMESQAVMRRRLSVPDSKSVSGGLTEPAPSNVLGSLAARVDEKKFGIEGALRSKLRRDLVRAGYFSDDAIRFYVIARLGLVLVLPTAVFILCKILLPDLDFYKNLLLVGISAVVGIVGVDAYIARRRRLFQQEYRGVFPDLIDMLVVCSDAGLSLDAAFGRIGPEVSKKSPALGTNLAILGAETRAGRSMEDALAGFAERVNLEEARSFVIMLRQSLELGTDMGDTLRIYSDEMRGKRLLRAEETANKLPVKMVLPLGALIFPVILLVVLLPIIINLMGIFQKVG
jgi:tight adherence protein C